MAASAKQIAEQLRRIEVRPPAQLIVEQLRDLIKEGVLKPGQKLPSERIMAERFEVSRGILREALRKLEFYGVLRTLPQSGTVLENLGATTLIFLMDNILDMPANDFATLAEARIMIETHAARLAAEKATPKQVAEIRQVHQRIADAVQNGKRALEENMLLHLRIAGASGNPVIRSFVSQIEPEIMRLAVQYDTYRDDRIEEVVAEHEQVVTAIEKGDGQGAADAMARHLENARRKDASYVAESDDETRTGTKTRKTAKGRRE
ncbi:MAG: FadR family transcriptional regulator [Rhodospirillales bacterium]|nr:FadR family transcriptional regulator [Rhodospirillales bacterium]